MAAWMKDRWAVILGGGGGFKRQHYHFHLVNIAG